MSVFAVLFPHRYNDHNICVYFVTIMNGFVNDDYKIICFIWVAVGPSEPGENRATKAIPIIDAKSGKRIEASENRSANKAIPIIDAKSGKRIEITSGMSAIIYS